MTTNCARSRARRFVVAARLHRSSSGNLCRSYASRASRSSTIPHRGCPARSLFAHPCRDRLRGSAECAHCRDQRPATAPRPRASRSRARAVRPNFLALLAPRRTFILYGLLGLAMPLLAGVVATKTFAVAIRATAWTLAFAVFVNEFRVLAEMGPGLHASVARASDSCLSARRCCTSRITVRSRGFCPTCLPCCCERIVQAVLLRFACADPQSIPIGCAGVARTLPRSPSSPRIVLMFSALAWILVGPLPGCSRRRSPEAFAASASGRRDAAHAASVVVLFTWAAGILTFALSHSALDDLIRLGTFIPARASAPATDDHASARSFPPASRGRDLVDQARAFRARSRDPPAARPAYRRAGRDFDDRRYVLVVTGFVLAMAALGIDLPRSRCLPARSASASASACRTWSAISHRDSS